MKVLLCAEVDHPVKKVSDFPAMESLVSDIPAGAGEIASLLLQSKE
jgi:hypothetical protein